MQTYHKIPSLYLRDPDTKFKTFLAGQYSTPELEWLAECEYPFWCSEKIDGTNIRVHWDGEVVTFGGRTDRAQIPAHLVNLLKATFTEDAMAAVFDGPATLYGEGFGYKIQKVGKRYGAVDFILFDVKVGSFWLVPAGVRDVAQDLGIPCVEHESMSLSDAEEKVREGFTSEYSDDPTLPAEGMVMTPLHGLLDRGGRRIVTKLKTRDFR